MIFSACAVVARGKRNREEMRMERVERFSSSELADLLTC